MDLFSESDECEFEISDPLVEVHPIVTNKFGLHQPQIDPNLTHLQA